MSQDAQELALDSAKRQMAEAVQRDIEDNWQDRTVGMICKTCMFFVLKRNGPTGRCRRNAPTMKGFPVVYPGDWCGEHRLND